MNPLVKEAWDEEWNYSDEFYCTVDLDFTITSANSSYKEWFEIMVGEKLVGLSLKSNERIQPVIGIEGDDTLIIRKMAPRVDSEVIYRAKKIKDENDEFVGFVVKVEYLREGVMEIDPAVAQMRLNGMLTFDEKIVPLFG